VIDLKESVAEAIRRLDLDTLQALYREQGRFLMIEDFAPPELLSVFLSGLDRVEAKQHRNFVPGQKKGAAVSRMILDENVSDFGEFYRAPALRHFLNQLTGEELLDCLETDAHTYALYLYNQPGDHIGWHYDTSFYRGKRFTVLLGLVENESCVFECVLHTRNPDRPDESRTYKIKPGSLVLFDGDQLRHRITRMVEGDGARAVLTLEYVTDRSMHPWRKLLSDCKDAFAYFGLRDVFFPRKTASGSSHRSAD